jgi:regulator of replication initiation timing
MEDKMSDKSIEQLLFEYEDPRGRVDMSSTDDQSSAVSTGQASFDGMKKSLGSYERMVSILSGEEQFEYNILDNPKMVRALVDQVKQMIKNKDKLNLENKSISQRIKELKRIEMPTRVEIDELENLLQKDKAFQLQKTLMRFDKSLDELSDILDRMENGVDLQDKTIKRYDKIVGDIEDAIFQETYVRKNLAYEKGEASGNMKKPTATDNFPVKFLADNGKTYYGIVRPPSGIITWEGSEAREAFLRDSGIRSLLGYISQSKKYSRDALLKVRISKDDFKVLNKEMLNDKLFSLVADNGRKKFVYNDSDSVKEAIRNYILSGEESEVTHYDTMGGGSIDNVIDGVRTKSVNPSLDSQGRPKDLTSIIDSIEFWRFIRGLI